MLLVLAASDGYGMDRFRESTRTDAEGRFEFQGYPDLRLVLSILYLPSG
jgi:hypothetical protein